MAEPADPYAGWTEVPAETDAPPKSFDGWTEVPVNDAPPPAQSGNPARSTQDVSAGYRPIDFEQQLDAPPHHEQLSEDAQRIRDVVGSLVAPTTEDGVDKLSAVLKLAHDTNLPFNTVAEKFDDIYAQHELAKVSPEQWLKENPQLGEFVLRNKAAGVMVAKDKPFAEVSRAINRVIGFVFPSKEDVAAWQKEKPTENMGAEWEARHKAAVEHPNVTTAEDLQLQPGKEQLKRDEQSQAINESPMGFLYVPGLRSKEAVAGLNADVTWWEIRNRRLFGKPTSTLERVAYGYELESQPREYEQGEVGTFVSSAASGVSSSLYITGDIIKGTTAGGLIAGGVGAIGGYIGGGPAGAAEFGLLGLGVGARGGATGGAYFGTAKLEGGGAYKELLRSKLDDGTPVSEPFAAAGSILYENLAAAIEVGLGTVGPLPKALGPAGDLIKNRSRKAAVAELLKNPAFMGAAKRFAKELATTTFEESGEEGLQAMAKDAVSYFASSAQAGGFQKGEHGAFGAVDVGGAIEQSVAAIPASLVQGAYSAGYSHLARKTFQDRALESHEVVKLLAGFTDSPTAHAAPEDVAEALQVGGLRKSVFIEPEAFIRLNQDAKVPLDQATAEFLGENGAEHLAEARAAGKMVEVPLQRYIEKWSGTALAKAMVPHSTVSADLPTPAAINETEMKAAVDALAKRFDEGEEAEPESPGEARWQAATEKQLAVVTGDVEEARQKMSLMRAALRTWAQRFGQSADELFRDQAVIVEAGLNPTAQEVLSRRATELTGEQRAEELYRDEPTGLPNERAFRATKTPAGKMVGRVAVEGVKWLNDNVSHDRADMMVRSVALALEREGIKPHRIGGADFGFYVQDEAELHSIMERVKAALPESVKGFSITGAMGGDLDIAGKYLDVLHDRLIGEGTRANPRPVLQDTEGLAVLDSEGNEQVLPAERPKGLPEGVAPSSLEFQVVRASPELEQQLKERVGSLKPEDYFNEAYVDPKTGEWTALGWKALPRKKHVASLDVAGLRRANERYGKAIGNLMLEIMGLEAQLLGGTTFDFAHLHGDEYAAQSDDPKALEAFVENLRSRLHELSVPYEESETGELTYIPLEFHNGFSDDYKLESADADLNERKRRLKKARQAGLERRRSEPARSGADNGAAKGSTSAIPRTAHPSAPTDAAQEKVADYPRARAFLARATKNKAEASRWFRWCVELKGKGERPKVSWAIESTLAKYGVVDPINGFSGNEAGRDTARPMKSQGYVKQTGVGLTGRAADAFAEKKSTPMGRNIFTQPPNERTLFYQFPTPEESLANMQAERVLRDKLLESGEVVGTLDAMVEGVRAQLELLPKTLQEKLKSPIVPKIDEGGSVRAAGRPARMFWVVNQQPSPGFTGNYRPVYVSTQYFETLEQAVEFARENPVRKFEFPTEHGRVQYTGVTALNINWDAMLNSTYGIFNNLEPAEREYLQRLARLRSRVLGENRAKAQEIGIRRQFNGFEANSGEEALSDDLGEMLGDRRKGKGPPMSKNLSGQATAEQHLAELNRQFRLEQSKKVTETEAFKTWFGDSKVVDEHGQPKVVYHGSQRPDRIGNRFQKSRATSGPSAFFTDDPEIASSYSTNKNDTSLDIPTDYSGWFKMRLGRGTVDLDQAWNYLTPEQRTEIAAKLPHVVHPGEDRSQYAFDPDEYGLAGKSHWDHEIRQARGNVLKAAKEIWLNGGELVNDEGDFMKVLELGGAKGIFEFADPHATNAGVIPVYLSVQNPLVTSKISPEVVSTLEKASRRQREPTHNHGVDQWDKRAQSPSTWIESLKSDLESGTSSHAWTSIPDWVTKTLKGLGYDGIHDVGGKNGGSEHGVWIPFEPTQIKSATGNRGTFDSGNPNILKAGPHEAPRGYTEIFNEGMKRLFKVVLNPSADHSTFLHESAHIFLELMTDLAARSDAPERLKEDYATVLKWLDAKGPEDLVVKSESKTDPARERHEKWAKAFERYLLEGKSPARKLVRMFERFRLWLSRVYRTPQMQAHLGELNADIRSVFDRMLATDREIENYEKAMGLDAPVARDVFDTDEDYEKFLDSRMEVTASVNRRLDLASAKDRLREQEGWWKDELKKERELAEEAYEKLPARIAQQTLAGKGELGGIDGPLRLAREDVVAAVGEENVKKFKITTKESEKVSPDEVAEFLNFPTGKAMLEAVLKLPQKDGWVKQRAEEAMREKHPDIVNDMARLKEHVAKGLHGDATLEHVMLQWAALKKKLTDSGKHAWEYDQTPIEAIRRYVKDRVARRTIDRLDVGQALRAERRAADASAIAAMKGNYALAFRQKQKQLLNMFMWMELTHAREEREKFYELATKMSRDVDGGRTGRSSALGKAHPTYREAAASLLEAVGLREPDENHPGASIEELVSRMEADNQVVAIDEVALSNIEIKPRGHKDLTVAEMRVVRDALANIKAAANGQTTVMRGEKRVDFDEQAERIADEGNRAPPIPPSPETGAESIPEMIGGWWQSADGSMLTPETMFGWLANDIHSEVFQSFVLPMQQAKHAEVDLLRGPIKRIVNAFDKMPSAVLSSMRDLVDGKALFPGHTDIVPVPNRRFQILLMLLNSGNESNLKRLTEGRGITEQQLRDAAVKVGITKEEYDWVQSVWDACEDLKKPAFDLEEKMNGVRPEAIVARAFDTPFGQYKGGYFPAVYDKRGLSGVGESQLLSQVMDPHYTPAGTHRSHLKKRADDFADIISLTPQSIYRHLSQVAHDIAFREPVQSVARLLDDDRVKKMLMQRLGDKRFDRLTEWVKDVGRGRGTEGNTHIPAFATLMHTLRAGMSMAVLGGSLQNAIEDLVTGLVTAVPGSELESQHLAAGIAAVRSGFNENVTAAEAKSGELRTRRNQLSRELLSNISKLIAKTPIGRGPLRKIKDHAFITQEYTDRVVSSAIWIGAERQALAKGETPADAIIFADKVVRGLLPSHHVVDSSAMMRNENIAAMLVFFRYFNTVYNISRRNGPGFFSNVSTPKRAAEALGFLFGMAILGSLARGQGPDPGEPWDQWFTRKLVSGQLGKYPWMGELFELGWTPLLRTSNAHLGTDFVLPKGVREPRNNSIVGMLSSIALLAAKAADGNKEADVRLEAAVRAMGLLSGQPVSQPLKSSMYGYRVFSGQLDPRGPGDVAGGIVYGQGEHQAANVPTLIQDFAEGGVQGVIEHPGPR